MSDWLVELGANPTSRKVLKSLGLPIPLPAALPRDRDAWRPAVLDGRRYLFESQSAAQATLDALGAKRATLGDSGKSDADVLVFDARACVAAVDLAAVAPDEGRIVIDEESNRELLPASDRALAEGLSLHDDRDRDHELSDDEADPLADAR